MSASSTDKIKDMICLTRGLCEAPGLLEHHLASRHTLKGLTQTSYMRDNLGLDGLHLWTFCSQQKFSSAIRMENCGHILFDGFQADAMLFLFQALALAPDNGPLAVMLPAMLSEDYLNANDVGMADVLMDMSIAGARRFPYAISGLQADLRFQREVQRIFLIAHELGHLLLANSALSQQWTAVAQLRLDHAIQFVLSKQQGSHSDAWMLRGSDTKFRDELFCDTVATEMIEAVLAQPIDKPSEWQRLAFEAIYFTAFGLDLLRTLKRVAGSSENSLDVAVTNALLGREFIRSVSLNLLAQSRFGVNKMIVDSLQERVDRAQRSEFGLLDMLSNAEHHRQRICSDAQIDDQKRARLYSLYQWRADPRALFQDQIY